MNRNKETTELNVIVKADAQGSLTSVIDSLKALDTQEVVVRVVGSGIGHVTENDIYMAQTSNAIIYGFNITMQSNVKQLAAREKVTVRTYNVIYELIEDAREELSLLLSPEVVETQLGRLVVKAVFKTTRNEVICGGEVTKGKLEVQSMAYVMRGDEQLG
jgi:translation initiation factor IF-2